MTPLQFGRAHGRAGNLRNDQTFLSAYADALGITHRANDGDDDEHATAPWANDDTMDESLQEDNDKPIGSRHFGSSILNLIGKRSHDVQEFMSRIRAQEMSQVYEQEKTADYELNKLQPGIDRKIGSSSFGPCMTYKQAVERIQEQQMFKGKENQQSADVTKHSTKPDHHRSGALTNHPFSMTMRPQNPWKLSEVEKQRSLLAVGTTAAKQFHSLSSQSSVAPTEPESPMSCDSVSVFC